MYWPYRRAYEFRVTPGMFHLALLLDAQRWSSGFFDGVWIDQEMRIARAMPLPVGMLGYRTALIKLLKRWCDENAATWRREKDGPLEWLVYWEPWRGPRPTPRYTVTVYGITHSFNEYMNEEKLMLLMHKEHSAKGFWRAWCLHCNPGETYAV